MPFPPVSAVRAWLWPSTARDAALAARRVDWSQRHPFGGLALLPAVVISLAFGAWRHDPEAGVMAAGGAVAVGFGAFHRLGRYRSLPLGVTLIAMAVSTFAGSVAHRGGWIADAAVATVWGWAFGLVTTLGWGAWWVGLQGIVGLLAFGAIPADVPTAAYYAAMIVAGGLLQLAAAGGVWRYVRLPELPDEAIPGAWRRGLIKAASPRTPGGRHALRVAIALGVGSTLHHVLAVTHGQWLPMTAAILLKPDLHETIARGAARLLGTLVGAGVVTVLIALTRPGALALNVGLVVAIWACFTLQRVNYALYAVCITAYVVFVLTAAGLPEPGVAGARVLATLGGAVLALAVHAVPLKRRGHARPALT